MESTSSTGLHNLLNSENLGPKKLILKFIKYCSRKEAINERETKSITD